MKAWFLFLFESLLNGGVDELTAMLTLDDGLLQLLSATWIIVTFKSWPLFTLSNISKKIMTNGFQAKNLLHKS